jgi:hypothetical protein
MDNDAIIVPQPGKEKETIRLLLDLADHRRHVRTNTDGPGLVLVVPEYLAKKYNQSGETEVTGVKRRGRPPGSGKKAAQAPAEAETPESED